MVSPYKQKSISIRFPKQGHIYIWQLSLHSINIAVWPIHIMESRSMIEEK